MILRLSLLAMLVGVMVAPASAQVAPVPVVVTKNVDPTNAWYQAQQWLHEGQTQLNDWNTLQYMIKNFQKAPLASNLIPLNDALNAMDHDINAAIRNHQDPTTAAQLARNPYIAQNLTAISELTGIINSGSSGSSQMMQSMNLLLESLASSNMQQAKVDYAAAQQQLIEAGNAQAIHAANDADTSRP